SPGAAVALLKMNTQIDIRGVLPTIHSPTLVMHRTGDRDVNFAEGRWMAARIPGARFVELPGDDHLPWVGDQDSVLDEVQAFLTGVRPVRDVDRVLATVLFTDIVGSTQHLARGGPGVVRIAGSTPCDGAQGVRRISWARGEHRRRRILRDLRWTRAGGALRAAHSGGRTRSRDRG